MVNALQGARIAWVLPNIDGAGSGGIQTIFRHIAYLQDQGALCDVCCLPSVTMSQPEVARLVREAYGFDGGQLLFETDPSRPYDVAIATQNNTVERVLALRAPHKAYFVQDYEPLFYPMGDEHLRALTSYRAGLTPITIGDWLCSKLDREYGTKAYATPFCADKALYHQLEGVRREQAICAIWQPDKPRRCARMVEEALAIVHEMRPEVEIILFGSNEAPDALGGVATNAGILTKQGCNELYNRCAVGLSVSASNPSRIPFEMMASGLPVVDLYLDNNLYDFPEQAVLLAEATPESVATALLMRLDDADASAAARAAGMRLMAERPIELETQQFAAALCALMQGGAPAGSVSPRYHGAPVGSSELAAETARAIRARKRAAHDAALLRAMREREPITSRFVRVSLAVDEPARLSVEGLRAYVWHDAQQADLHTYALSRASGDEGGAVYEAVVDLSLHGNVSGSYAIDVYGSVDGKDRRIVHGERTLVAPGDTPEPEAPAADAPSADKGLDVRLEVAGCPEPDGAQQLGEGLRPDGPSEKGRSRLRRLRDTLLRTHT